MEVGDKVIVTGHPGTDKKLYVPGIIAHKGFEGEYTIKVPYNAVEEFDKDALEIEGKWTYINLPSEYFHLQQYEYRANGRDMYSQSAVEFAVSKMPQEKKVGKYSVSIASEKDAACGFRETDIVRIRDGYLDNLELEILSIRKKGVVFKVFKRFKSSDTNLNTKTKGEIVGGYPLDKLAYAKLIKRGKGIVIPSKKIWKNPIKDLYLLEVEDFANSMEEWKQQVFYDFNINIGITVHKVKGGMYNKDVLPELPELNKLDLGKVEMDDSGFLGFSTKLTAEEVVHILVINGYKIYQDI